MLPMGNLLLPGVNICMVVWSPQSLGYVHVPGTYVLNMYILHVSTCLLYSVTVDDEKVRQVGSSALLWE